MTGGVGVAILLVIAFTAASLPFFSERILFLRRPAGGRKALGWRLAELLVLYLAAGLLARAAETRAFGAAYPQGWEFYAITFCLFLVLAFPGFIYKYLWRARAN
ncbi:MAG: DUF2818 family protein [Betaproteobacteria bacterium]|nr:DUF2818 family protein [Betaproteobacteria bacterium]